ncbi:proline dehydrogenase/delta-1-pyrroline-5-carboxylate dehydrogenase, partial [Actinomyces sp. oral taxon 178 str. F0338]
GTLDEELPEELHAELVWAVAAALDRWMASRADGHADSRALVRAVMARLLGAPGAP